MNTTLTMDEHQRKSIGSLAAELDAMRVRLEAIKESAFADMHGASTSPALLAETLWIECGEAAFSLRACIAKCIAIAGK